MKCREQGLDVYRGCRPGTAASPEFNHVTAQGLRFDRCPKAWAREQTQASQWIDDFVWLRDYGALPVPGSKLDQDPLFIDACAIIRSEIDAAEEVQRGKGRRHTSHSHSQG